MNLNSKAGVGQLEIPQTKTFRKKPLKKKLSGGRRSIIALFLLTIGAIILVLAATEIPPYFERLKEPIVVGSLLPEREFDPQPVIDQIRDLTEDLLGTYGVAVYRLSDGQHYGINQNEIFPAASLMKLPVMLTLYQEAESRRGGGQLGGGDFLETKYVLKDADKVGGAGILAGKTAGVVFTYRQLAEYMGKYSDNTAYMVLRRVLGDRKIQSTIEALEMKNTFLKDNKTTPEDMALLFQKLYLGKVLKEGSREEILRFLTNTMFEDWLPAGVPKGIRVAHKIGRDVKTFSDGGVVFAESPYIVVVMSKEARESQAVEILPKISRAIWEFESKKPMGGTS